MRVALIAASIFLLLLMFVLLPWAAVLGAIAVLGLVALRRSDRGAGRVIAAAWLLGGALLALGWTELAWQDRLDGAFVWLAGVGGVLLAAGFLLLPTVAHGRSGWLAASGLAVTVFGFATAFFGGFVLMPVGVAL